MVGLFKKLPKIRGKYRESYDLSKTTWFRVGGLAEILFRPADEVDLVDFLKNKPSDIDVTILGLCSNILVRDGGIDGVVIRLGGGFSGITLDGGKITIGAGCVNTNLTKFCIDNGIAGLEFLSGIPGCIGGALAMNAGAYGSEVKDVLIEARAVDKQGNIHIISNDEMGFSYRCNKIPDDWIFTSAVFQGKKEDSKIVAQRVVEIAEKREQTQPIRTRTGGSTFRNPQGEKKAWQLVDEVGARGLQIGGAQVSTKHCNFLINTGNATASDIENLGQEVRKKVKENSDIDLHWEIKRIGKES